MFDKESKKARESSIVSRASNSGLSLGIQGDNPNAQITTIKLDGTNYLEWSQFAKMCIGRRGKIWYINGHVKEPSVPNTQAYDKWESENLIAMF